MDGRGWRSIHYDVLDPERYLEPHRLLRSVWPSLDTCPPPGYQPPPPAGDERAYLERQHAPILSKLFQATIPERLRLQMPKPVKAGEKHAGTSTTLGCNHKKARHQNPNRSPSPTPHSQGPLPEVLVLYNQHMPAEATLRVRGDEGHSQHPQTVPPDQTPNPDHDGIILDYICPENKEKFGPLEPGTFHDVLVNQPISNNQRAEPFYMITGLNRNVVHTLCTQPVWSTKVGTLFVLPHPLPLPTFAVSLMNFTCHDNTKEKLHEVLSFLHENPAFCNMVTVSATELNVADIDSPAGADKHMESDLCMVELQPLKIPRGDNEGYKSRWNLYINCLIPPKHHSDWAEMLRSFEYKAKWGTGTNGGHMRCSYCSSVDHQRAVCKFQALPNWFDTKHTAPKAIPGQSIAPVISNSHGKKGAPNNTLRVTAEGTNGEEAEALAVGSRTLTPDSR
ncbi:hypothetical protein PUNSTDRAFT_46693 [Punctularia strigosozonata HHB-11173 SS5]|uniref:uncharacterized protein n=1 Tax=Punctularia strigosozonata (strain HHB-11173) TaxID=741275 RepID=UPI0004417455|nr:uncharacterized protein PUNSTDRAFT_46693 [Punctularia strigosozonata HHB-11173 SS5]EIN05873.1 hypothetical protein PUNSTDRAFT_46693 [Punctularia strigosozonata HHB-11173 SS5]